MTNHDPYDLLPRERKSDGWPYGTLRPLLLQVRTTTQYDATFLQDVVVAEIFINGRSTRIQAKARVDDREFPTAQSMAYVIERYGPELERMVIDEFVTGGGMRERVQFLEGQSQRAFDKTQSLAEVADEQWDRINGLEAQVSALRARLDRPNWVVRAALAVRSKLGSWFR